MSLLTVPKSWKFALPCYLATGALVSSGLIFYLTIGMWLRVTLFIFAINILAWVIATYLFPQSLRSPLLSLVLLNGLLAWLGTLVFSVFEGGNLVEVLPKAVIDGILISIEAGVANYACSYLERRFRT